MQPMQPMQPLNNNVRENTAITCARHQAFAQASAWASFFFVAASYFTMDSIVFSKPTIIGRITRPGSLFAMGAASYVFSSYHSNMNDSYRSLMARQVQVQQPESQRS